MTGIPWITGISSRIKFTAVDIHGSVASTYITFEIDDFTV